VYPGACPSVRANRSHKTGSSGQGEDSVAVGVVEQHIMPS
jgi:hypothetical protein